MNKKRIALDVDDILSDMVPYWLRKFNRHAGTSFTVDDVKDWYFPCIPREGREYHYGLLKKPSFWRDMQPLPGAAPALQSLSSHYEYMVVTSMPPAMVKYRVEWLERHYPFLLQENVVFVGSMKAKRFINADILIDDCPLLEEVLPNTIYWIVRDRPYNKHVKEGPTVHRCRDWHEIGRLLRRMAQEVS